MKKFDQLTFVKAFIRLVPRQEEGEVRAAKFLMSILKKNRVPFTIETFSTSVPRVPKASLVADGKNIPCRGCSMVGGDIRGNYKIISSLISSSVLQDEANINFNPRSQEISNSNYYFAPSVAVSRKSLSSLFSARSIKGSVTVKKITYRAIDILVGNTKNPTYVCFAHYDSIETGAIDNASGVSTLLAIILLYPGALKHTLFVFAANEELSYDKPVYWGRGFRMFEKRHGALLNRVKKILVVDSVGNGKTKKVSDIRSVMLGFPVRNVQRWLKKIVFLSGDFDHLMEVYHSKADDGRGMSKRWLQDARNMVVKEILG